MRFAPQSTFRSTVRVSHADRSLVTDRPNSTRRFALAAKLDSTCAVPVERGIAGQYRRTTELQGEVYGESYWKVAVVSVPPDGSMVMEKTPPGRTGNGEKVQNRF